ncbi:MAG: bifunctional metallophosphatase/5'-nucleotidase, partial [Elusimicrobia bacterium]|nr:bifunctional metallophosphatase/5'-nucleotidase [Elusimicrobiota bacterium]
HEFDYGEDNFRALASSAPFAAVNCNIYDRDTGKRLPYLKPWVIVESNGVKIGVTGVLEPLVEKTLSKPLEHLNIREPAPEVLKVIPEMKKAGAQAYVVLAHMGIHRYCPGKSADQCEDGPFISSSGLLTLARALKGKPALVFGGHMHKQQPEGYSEGGVWVAESGELAKTFTRAALEFGDKSGKYEGAKMKVLPSDPARYGQDPKVLAAVRALTAMAGGELDTRLAENRQTLGKALFSQWMTDVYRAKYGTDLAFAQSSSIRRELAAGTLTGRDIYLTIPYENTMMLEELKGADVLSALRDNFSFSGRKHMMFSGMEAEYDLDKEGKLLAVRAFVDGKPLDPDKYYTVALNSYLLSGVSYGQAFLRGRDIRDTGTSIRQPLIERLSKDGELRYQDDGRARQTTR